MPDSLLSDLTGPYREPPPPVQVEEFLNLVRETGEPEQIPGLSRTPPDLGLERHELVCELHVPAAQRPSGEFIPCAICNDQPKFLHGAVLWSADGWLRLIGHCCAHEYFQGGRFSDIVDRARRKKMRITQEYWLIDNLPKVPGLVTSLEALRPAAEAIQREQKALLSGAPRLTEMLRRAFKERGGALTVVRERKNQGLEGPAGFRSSTGGTSDFEENVVGTLAGGEFLSTSFRPIAKLDDIAERLAMLPSGDALETVAEMSEMTVFRVTRALQETLKAGEAFVEKLRATASFLDIKNAVALRAWAEDPDNPLRISVEIQGQRVRVRLDDANVAAVNFAPPAISDLVGWDLPPPA